MKRIDVAIGIVQRDGKVLICQRRQQDHLAGFWEFPGGKLEAGELCEQCLVRELAEEVGIEVRPIEALAAIEYDYPAVHVRLHPYLCEWLSGEAKPLAAQQVLWVDADDLAGFRFPPANDGLIGELARRFGTHAAP